MKAEIPEELLTLYEIVGDGIWSPSSIPEHLRHRIKHWISNGQITLISRRYSNKESRYCISQNTLAKIIAEKTLRQNPAHYQEDNTALKELAASTGLPTKYLTRRLSQIQQLAEI